MLISHSELLNYQRVLTGDFMGRSMYWDMPLEWQKISGLTVKTIHNRYSIGSQRACFTPVIKHGNWTSGHRSWEVSFAGKIIELC